MIEANLPIALGCMGLTGTWNPAEMNAEREKRAIAAFEAALEAGITLFDHADIYGGGTCEEVFQKCLKAVPNSREKIQIWTKGGICAGFYDLSPHYLSECIERSRRRMGIEAIDLFQLHRPDPLAHPRDTAKALHQALKNGHIKAVGVSNYFPEQVRALQNHLDTPIVSNQISISLLRLDPIYEGWPTATGNVGDGVLDQCMALDIRPLAYSPLGKAALSKDDADDERILRIQKTLARMAGEYDATRSQIALAWLLKHPAQIIPVVGSANPAHIREAAEAVQVEMSREDWYELWTAAWGRKVP